MLLKYLALKPSLPFMKYCDKAQSLGGPISLKRMKLGNPQIVQAQKMAYYGTDQNNNTLE